MKFNRLFKSSCKEYKDATFYEEELEEVNQKIRNINKTIKFYENKRRILEEWKSFLKISIKKDGGEEICMNCDFFKNNSCLKYGDTVNKEATCPEFKWNVSG